MREQIGIDTIIEAQQPRVGYRGCPESENGQGGTARNTARCVHVFEARG